MTEQIKIVGVVGLGRMGAAIARHIRKAGYRVIGSDLDAAATARAAASGIEPARTLADMSAADLVLVTVGFDDQLESVIAGPGGLLDSLRSGAVIGVISTASPDLVVALAEKCAARSVVLLDIPVCRGEEAAEKGDLLVLGAGDAQAFERCRPVLASFASGVTHVGGVGAGQVAKMVNNLIFWACLSANYEGMKLAGAYGVSLEALREALVQSSANNWALQTRAEDKSIPWAEKDMSLVQQQADELKISLPLSGLVREVVRAIKLERGLLSPKR